MTSIRRNGSQPAAAAPPDYFTGRVRIENPFSTEAPSSVQGAVVTFEPGARTAWHTHPRGQTLIVLSGLGWIQREGGPVEEIRPGDTVWFAPGERHWHGASATTGMSHVALQEAEDGKVVDWLEHVTDAQYRAPSVSE
ncbi:MAG: cupin domain-containing protein [Brevundimonas sp.]|nr:cupin domain-containing protein [Brevundimonas sp.]